MKSRYQKLRSSIKRPDKPEALISNKATEVMTETSQCLSTAQDVLWSREAEGTCAESTSHKFEEMYRELCRFMGNAPLCLEEMGHFCQDIVLGQKYPNNWFKFTQLIEQAVTEKISPPPLERLGSEYPVKVLQEYLQQVQETVLEELKKLSPILRETPLLDCVVENFHRCVFSQLDQVLQCTLSADKTYLVLYWVASVYLSEELMGHPDIRDNCFKAVDLLVLSDWLQRAEKVFLAAVQEFVSVTLSRILHNEDIYWGACVPGDEEDFNKLHIDVIQVIQRYIEQAGQMSKQLKVKVQDICYPELLIFFEKYEKKEKKKLKMHAKSGELYPFRTFNRAMELRKYAETIAINRNDDFNNLVHSLKRIEADSLELVLRKLLFKAEVSLKEYFKKGDRRKMRVVEEIGVHFSNLPKANQDAYKTAAGTAYDRLISLYLKYLLQSNKSELERAWNDVESEVAGNAKYFDLMFSDLNPEGKERNQALLCVGEILRCHDLEAQKMTVAKTMMHCPGMSQELVHSLLRWKGLPRSQVNEVLEACQEFSCTFNEPNNKPRWYHCCCY